MAYWLDDGFDTWPQVVRAGAAATGLYVRCGAWISRSIGNGITADAVVPADVAAMYGTPEWVAKLVDVGLWRTEEAGYRDVYYFRAPNGAKLNPTTEQVARNRAQRAASNARYYEKQAEKKAAERKTPPRRVLRRSDDASQDESQDAPPSLPHQGKGRARAPAPTHLPSCPYTDRDPATCPTCASERKADGAA